MTWGGARKGSGRKKHQGLRRAHTKRVQFFGMQPLHVMIKVKPDLPNLRSTWLKKKLYRAARRAKDFGLFISQFSIQSNHLHLIAEAKCNRDLAEGMKSFNLSLSKNVAFKYFHRSRKVLAARYHFRRLVTYTQIRNCLRYVLLNRTRHIGGEPVIDSFSSGRTFYYWKELGLTLTRHSKMQRPTRSLSEPISLKLREKWRQRNLPSFLPEWLTTDIVSTAIK